MTNDKPEFRRQESWRYKRVAENWRRPRGVTSKMRKEESGFPAKVKIGYGTSSTTRARHPRGLLDRLVWRESELDSLDPKVHVIRVAGRVGERKRLGIVTKAKEQNFHIANPGKEESRPVAETSAEKKLQAVAEVEASTEQADEPMETATSEEAATGEEDSD
jgi:large subunit ribosomal protein L32e